MLSAPGLNYCRKDLDKEFKIASKNIRQANKGGKYPVCIDKNYELKPHNAPTDSQVWISMQIHYSDSDGRKDVYNIAL